jgi:hypothetical protein
MAFPSKQVYGQRLSPQQNNRIDTWLEPIPYDWQLEDANTARLVTITVYEDWLDWSKARALSWLAKLDRRERRFRVAGIAYHKVPHTLRHSTTHFSSIEWTVLLRLSQMFETSRARSQQSFFHPWNEIFDAANEVLEKVRGAKETAPDIDGLRILESGCEVTLSQLPKPLRNLEAALLWAEEQVAKLVDRSDLDGAETLAAKHSREGSMFRMWIQTFLEVEHRVVKSKSAYTEAFVDGMMGGEEIARDPYWTMMAVGADENL